MIPKILRRPKVSTKPKYKEGWRIGLTKQTLEKRTKERRAKDKRLRRQRVK